MLKDKKPGSGVWTPEKHAARLALIKKVHKEFLAKQSKKQKVRQARSNKRVPNIDSSIDKFNINEYTDASKYADEYYGDRARAQSSYENDWN